MRLIDAEAFEKQIEKEIIRNNTIARSHFCNTGEKDHIRSTVGGTLVIVKDWVNRQPTIEAKPVVHAHWISSSWEENEEDGIENTYSDEFICSNCKEHFYFPDAIEEEDIEIYFCPYCGATMDESISCSHENDMKGE
jgi:DNA-directed RNA polymerase subunit RPC12/RpoP